MKNGWWGRPLVPEILDQTDPDLLKTPIYMYTAGVWPEEMVWPARRLYQHFYIRRTENIIKL